LFQHVHPLFFADYPDESRELQIGRALDQVRRRGFVAAGDRVIFTHGTTQGEPGGTNTLKILTV
jgi:pyruvate kinase